MESMHTVVARFEQQQDAREAMVDLELKGIDADAIHLVSSPPALPTNEQGLDTDVEVGGRLARSSAAGAVLGGVAGAVVMAAVLLAVGVRPVGTVILASVLAGGAGGAFIGAYWGVARRLPVNDDVFDTYVVDVRDAGGVLVEVQVEDYKVEADAVAVLRRHHAQQIDREGH